MILPLDAAILFESQADSKNSRHESHFSLIFSDAAACQEGMPLPGIDYIYYAIAAITRKCACLLFLFSRRSILKVGLFSYFCTSSPRRHKEALGVAVAFDNSQ